MAKSKEAKRRESPSAYARRKERERQRQADMSKEGRDIALDFPKAKLPEVRKRVEKSLEAFCITCMPEKFKKAFSEDHRKAIAKMERTILHGENFCIAMPRGSGKTTLVIAAILWAILCGYKRYVALIGADRDAAKKLLTGIKTELENNDELLELFPEAVWPIRKLERIAHRCRGQLYKGDPTYIVWTGPTIVFATIPDAKCSGAVIECAGILGKVRGMQYTTPKGEIIRPDAFVVDDPQTNRSARSRTQNAQRLEVITGTCPGLAGPGEEISGFCCVTVIEEDDVADQLLNVEEWPDWQGERFQLVYEWPENDDLWEEYATIRAEGLAAGKGMGPANAFYKKNRKAMDKGAKIAWPERFRKDELSAIQHAWNLRLKLGDAFWKEYQNAPKSADDTEDLLSVEEIQAKVNGYARNVLPSDSNVITAFIDCHDKLLYWLVLAVRTSDFSSWILDYGAWPEQRAVYFKMTGVEKTLAKIYPKAGREGRVRQGLLDLINNLADRRYALGERKELRIKRIGIDAAYGITTRVVQAVARESQHRALILPSFGRGIQATDRPMETWRPKVGERRGIGWMIRPAEGGGEYALYDTNYWKNFMHARLGVAIGDPGALSLFKPELRTTHRMIAEQLRAELRKESKSGERTVQVWDLPPAKPDNHLADCTSNALALAGIEGAAIREHRTSRPKPKKKRRYVARS